MLCDAHLLLLSAEDLLTLLEHRELNTLGLRERDRWLGTITDDKHVSKTSSEGVSTSVLQVGNIERTWVLLDGDDSSDATNVCTASDHSELTNIELNVSNWAARLDIDLNGIVDTEGWISEADGAAVMGDDIWDRSQLSSVKWIRADRSLVRLVQLLDTAELVACLLWGDAVEDKATLDIIEETKLLRSLWECDNILKSSWIVDIRSDGTINLDRLAHHNLEDLTASQRIAKTVAEDQREWQALTKLVWTSRWTRSPGATELVKHPMLWRIQALHMLLWTTSHGDRGLTEGRRNSNNN
jgi:hypothetical protein